MKIPKEILYDLAYSDEGEEYKGFRLADKEFITVCGEAVSFRSVIEDMKTHRFYETLFSLPATDYCTVTAYGGEPDQIELREVYPKIISHTIYESKQKTPRKNNKLLQVPE